MAEGAGDIRHRRGHFGTEGGQNGHTPSQDPNQNTQSNGWHQIPTQPEVLNGTMPQYRSAQEYAQAVQQWTAQYHWWNSMNWFYMTFPMYAMNCMSMQQLQQQGQGAGLGGAPRTPATPPPPRVPPAAATPTPAAGPAAAQQNIEARGHDFKIPTLWKRVVAEFIDFALLFLIKLGVTILTVEYVGMDIQKYDLDMLFNHNLDYDTAFAMTSELIAMEIINRIFICLFETLCLRKGMGGMIGGTTPGKRMLGLRVISVEEIIDLPENKVRVTPAGDIGVWNALVRSVIKNFSLAFFFPVCFTVFFFQHNRAAYDIISNCIVVEPTEEDLALGR